MDLYVFSALREHPWAGPLRALERALAEGDPRRVRRAYAALYRALLARGAASLEDALASSLLEAENALAEHAMRGAVLPEGLRAGALADLDGLGALVRRDWQAESARLGGALPPLAGLAAAAAPAEGAALRAALAGAQTEEALAALIAHYRRHGAGPLARALAFRWEDGLVPVLQPARPELARLVGLEHQLARLRANTEAFLAARPAQHALLYGPRGSGKSTAVRALLPRYAERGLRLVELPPRALDAILRVMEPLRGRPQRFVLFVDDLAFEAGDRGYGPLKSLLEGSLSEKPGNVLVYATSNRRHLVSERFSDRPDPLGDDVHGWDTVNERLALADRFGLTITFPSATQARFLEIVRALAVREGLELQAAALEERALRFASWGNGFSGRTAQQFVDTIKADVPLFQSGK